MNGMEMMLKSMGLGDIITQAQQMANDGTFAKIVEFANNAGNIEAQLAKQNTLLEKIARDYDNTCSVCGGPVIAPTPLLTGAGNGASDHHLPDNNHSDA